MMTPNARDLIHAVLERAAETLGDITPAVLARYHASHPEARACFMHHEQSDYAKLEAEMVSEALFCLMKWPESPAEVEIILLTTIPHHADTLQVPPDLFGGLINAVSETVANSIPADAPLEAAAWAELHHSLAGVVAEGAKDTHFPTAPAPVTTSATEPAANLQESGDTRQYCQKALSNRPAFG